MFFFQKDNIKSGTRAAKGTNNKTIQTFKSLNNLNKSHGFFFLL